MLILFLLSLSLMICAALAASNVTAASLDRTHRISSRVEGLLPQTQCRQCGYNGCRPYANAIARHVAPVDRCPPGGLTTANALAELIGAERVLVINPISPSPNDDLPVRIDETACIGCTKCLPVCPVDAIIGAQKQLHIVLSDLCTGCGLCIPPCPVDCIHPISDDGATV
ncbi:MAG: RnfABCDGE type electron transport complex subunit B [Gammaproteobacteria bacterium]